MSKKKLGALGAIAVAARVPARTVDYFSIAAHQQNWVRPNGEVITLRGFNPRELAAISPGLKAIDQSLKTKYKVNARTITAKNYASNRKAGLTYVYRKSSAITMNKRAVAGLNDTPEKFANVLVHEIAHGVDKKAHLSRGQYAKRTGWKTKSMPPKGSKGAVDWVLDSSKQAKMQNRNKLKAFQQHGHPIYQGSSLSEDFAETFAHTVHPIDRAVSHKVFLDHSRKRYMSEKLLNVQKTSHVLNLQHVPVHKRKEVYIIGTAAAAGGGYYYYRHRHNKLERVHKAQNTHHQLHVTSAHRR